MQHQNYLMESAEEILRLELKTDARNVRRQALWAGVKPGMRVADIGCGTGKATAALHRLASPGGLTVGIDASGERIDYAARHYGGKGIEFTSRDICEPLDDLGLFDFIWVRYLLEYYREESFAIVQNLSRILRPGGILCLIDLDYNCLTHFGLSPVLEGAIRGVIEALEENWNFDPYAGRKLYSYLFDNGYGEISVDLSGHHLIYGELTRKDAFNWMKKVEIAGRKSGYPFAEFAGGFDQFCVEFNTFFADPRRFTYTSTVACRGRKPLHP
jgi:SAM-dependent methyltransferase